MQRILYPICLTVALLFAACGEKTADDFEVWGLDVSRHQQDINWEKVAEAEKPFFVIIKATEGTRYRRPDLRPPPQRTRRDRSSMGSLPLFSDTALRGKNRPAISSKRQS